MSPEMPLHYIIITIIFIIIIIIESVWCRTSMVVRMSNFSLYWVMKTCVSTRFSESLSSTSRRMSVNHSNWRWVRVTHTKYTLTTQHRTDVSHHLFTIICGKFRIQHGDMTFCPLDLSALTDRSRVPLPAAAFPGSLGQLSLLALRGR